MSDRPIALFYGGTNGSGKSTLREIDTNTEIKKHIDPDAIARVINPKDPRSVDVAAGREAIRQFKEAIDNKTSFSMETTLTGNGILRRMEEAKSAGFETQLFYVGLKDADLNVLRVANRVAKGGHHIDEDVIRRRYTESQENLIKAIAICDLIMVRDNSELYPVTYLEIQNNQVIRLTGKKAPDWIQGIENKALIDIQTRKENAPLAKEFENSTEISDKQTQKAVTDVNLFSGSDSPSNRVISTANEAIKADKLKP
ncbi:hypothetical protein UNDKW_4858 [Undibacterium sp. KW1]|uniref:zeta toxin family protein n=1 Tax=Undibacterium sp. KW1 TaxID=2058624 RepID=UPI001331F589|nr:zeta toxin family protein [Undibacterium sp. KW1]BBB63131.1 hypothetical protein UNDKW_4858 [Undibacterium sp. KW1]